MKKFLPYFRGYGRDCFLAPLFKLLEALMDLAVPLVIAAMIDRGLPTGDTGFLFTGDAEKQAERDILEYCADNGISLQADVYKAGHHGSSTSSGDVLLEAVAPAWTVISCGKGNSYGHPHEETLEHFRMRGIQIYRTDEQGSIVAYSDGRDITWEVVGKSEE